MGMSTCPSKKREKIFKRRKRRNRNYCYSLPKKVQIPRSYITCFTRLPWLGFDPDESVAHREIWQLIQSTTTCCFQQ